jgi:hypothetical protein
MPVPTTNNTPNTVTAQGLSMIDPRGSSCQLGDESGKGGG